MGSNVQLVRLLPGRPAVCWLRVSAGNQSYDFAQFESRGHVYKLLSPTDGNGLCPFNFDIQIAQVARATCFGADVRRYLERARWYEYDGCRWAGAYDVKVTDLGGMSVRRVRRRVPRVVLEVAAAIEKERSLMAAH